MDPSQVISWLKLPQRVLWAFLIITGLVLWGPESFISGLGLKQFIETYRMYLGVVFLIFLAATLPTPIEWGTSKILAKIKLKKQRKEAQDRLHDLTPDEKEVLLFYVRNNTRTQTLDYTDGVTSALVSARIIYRASNLSQGYTDFAYNIQPWALEYLREHPEVLIDA